MHCRKQRSLRPVIVNWDEKCSDAEGVVVDTCIADGISSRSRLVY